MIELPNLLGKLSSEQDQKARRAKVVAATVREVCRVDDFRQVIAEKHLDCAHLSELKDRQ